MAPLVLEGETLGQKHRSFNNIVGNTQQKVVAEINYDDSDLDNLLKIEIACKNRNVNYVLKVFQSEDMLYVSRAIKRSKWMITDPRYAQIINPKYLHNNMCPNMTVKAFNKLMLHIRLNLKDKVRAEAFFNYYKDKDFSVAIKWLNLCSIQFIEQILEKHADDIPEFMIKRICEKSIKCFEIYLRSRKPRPYYTCEDQDQDWTIRYLKSNTEHFLILLESYDIYSVKRMGPQKTKLVLTRFSERIMANIQRFAKFLHVKSFANFIKRDDMEKFILRYINDMIYWFEYKELDFFIKRLPNKCRFRFVKEVFIERKHKSVHKYTIAYLSNNQKGYKPTSYNVYFWYKYAPFNTAFEDLKKLIRSESSPTERLAIVRVLLTCAGQNMNNIKKILKYYREHHINEAFKFKIQIVNVILSHTDTHKFDEIAWGYLNELFNSMQLSSESENNVQYCVTAFVLYNIVHNKSVPDIIEQKFTYDSFKSFQTKLKKKDKEKVFSYLYNYLITKMGKLNIYIEKQFTDILKVISHLLNLLDDWNRELKDYPVVLNKIKEIVHFKEENQIQIDVTAIKNIKKTWRKLLFSESFLLLPTQETCVNALKHDPHLLEKYKDIVVAICLNEKMPKGTFFQKVRIYWFESLANTYKELFTKKLDDKKLHKSSIIGLCNLLPKKDMSNLLEEYTPIELKTNKNQLKHNIYKHFAKSLYLARPQPSLRKILLYAKGNYTHYLNSSLNSIIYNTGSAKIREYLPRLLKGPICLKKHGLRIAFSMLNYNDLKKVISEGWKSARKKRVRGYIIIKTLNYLYKEKKEAVIKGMWELLSTLIDDLTSTESKLVYEKLSKFQNVPMLVRPQYYVKIYTLLKALPPHTNCNNLLADMRTKISDIIQLLDIEIVAEILLESFEVKFSSGEYEYDDLLSTFLLSTETEKKHKERLNKVLVPLLERSLLIWDRIYEQTCYVQLNLQRLFRKIDRKLEKVLLNQEMYNPVPLYLEIFEKLRENLPTTENYVLITRRKLALEYVKIFDSVLKSNKRLNNVVNLGLYYESASEIGKICGQCLKEDTKNYFPSLYILFAEALEASFEDFLFDKITQLRILQNILEFEEDPEFHILVLKLFPIIAYEPEALELKAQILTDISTHPSKEVMMHYWQLKGYL